LAAMIVTGAAAAVPFLVPLLSPVVSLIGCIVRQFMESDLSEERELDWKKLYGLGKGLWKGEDPQDYVNRLREDRL